MEQLWNIYHQFIPKFIVEFADATAIKRLKDIGMNCGCEYTSFPKFNDCKKYSRYVHSIGVAMIIWHFTSDIKQSVAGLVHDIATPVFAHTIDFFNNDHEKQQSTEKETSNIIQNSDEIAKLLKKYNLCIDDICDYHIYPIADNESPKLSADRLEYSLGNMVNYGFCNIKDVKKYYDDLCVGINEFYEPELIFKHDTIAIECSNNMIKNSLLYISDEDRFAMQHLADLIKFSIDSNVLTVSDLYTTEDVVIDKLKSNTNTNKLWMKYSSYKAVKKINVDDDDIMPNILKVNAKKRYIDPFVIGRGRVSSFNSEIKEKIDYIKNLDFNYYLSEDME